MRLLPLVVSCLAVHSAHADHVWRERGEIIAADGVTVVGLAVASASSGPTADKIAASMVVIALGGGPVIHLLEGHDGAAGASLLLRCGLPAAGALVGSGISKLVEHCDHCLIPTGTAVGFAAGWLAASILDIAYVTPHDPDPAAARTLSIGGTF